MVEDAKLYIGIAERHLKLGHLERAADNYELALRFEDRSMIALCGLTGVHLRAGRVDEARRTLARALEIDREDPDVLKLRAELNAKLGRFDLFVDNICDASDADLDRQRRRRS
ncbi:tetratricopeptide repeat protein [Planctomycetota bacterium]